MSPLMSPNLPAMTGLGLSTVIVSRQPLRIAPDDEMNVRLVVE